MIVKELTEEYVEECVTLYMDTFSREPWYDKYDGRKQVQDFFHNFLAMDSFLGYVAIVDEKVAAISVGMKKPWIQGIEYYIDEFCVDYHLQGTGIGSEFIQTIEQMNQQIGLDGMMLNTDRNYPSYKFYRKNGFQEVEDAVILVK